MLYKAEIGSISSGTMRTEDLLDTFAWVLRQLAVGNNKDHVALAEEANAVEDYDSEEADEILYALFDALNDYAPPYCTFGAHEGDGADYGFWPIWDQLDELPRLEAGSAHPEGEHLMVNDHGNVDLFCGEEHIWSVV